MYQAYIVKFAAVWELLQRQSIHVLPSYLLMKPWGITNSSSHDHRPCLAPGNSVPAAPIPTELTRTEPTTNKHRAGSLTRMELAPSRRSADCNTTSRTYASKGIQMEVLIITLRPRPYDSNTCTDVQDPQRNIYVPVRCAALKMS